MIRVLILIVSLSSYQALSADYEVELDRYRIASRTLKTGFGFCRFGYQFLVVGNKFIQVYERGETASQPMPCDEKEEVIK